MKVLVKATENGQRFMFDFANMSDVKKFQDFLTTIFEDETRDCVYLRMVE